jgi:thiamine kinase-like enzyme/ubiquinone/menaquinone biosynthesis C-methylase UbiE
MIEEKISSHNVLDSVGPNETCGGGIDQKTMKGIVQKSLKCGYLEVLVELAYARPDLGNYLLSHRRIDWLSHCLMQSNSRPTRALDLGSEWGTSTFLLAKHFDQVYSVESAYEKASFQAVRRAQTKEKNVHIMRCGIHKLPFPNEFFDIVVSNGPFEWVLFGDTTKDPKRLQLDFLMDAHRMLKVGGCLYIGVENRVAYDYFLGKKDHSGLPFTSLFPRSLTRCLVTLLGSYEDRTSVLKSHATYTYSALGYKKLLSLAGFNRTDIYCVTDYNFPNASWRITDIRAFDHFLKEFINGKKARLARFVLGLPKIMKNGLIFLFPNFSVFAYKGFKPETFENKLCNSLGLTDSCSFLRISANSDVTYHFLDPNGRPSYLVRIPRFKDDQSKLEKKEKLLAQINGLPLQKKYVCQIPVFIEKYVEGSHFKILNPEHNSKALEWLFDFQKATARRYSKEEIRSEIEILLDYVETLDTKYEKNIKEDLKNLIDSNHISVSEHGDFWAGNILFSNDRTYVLDWEDYRDGGNYLYDPLFFLITNSLYTEYDPLLSFYKNWTGAGQYSLILQSDLLRLKDTLNLDLTTIINSIPYVLLRKIASSDPRTNMWRNDFLTFQKLLDVWYRHKNEIDLPLNSNVGV